MFADCARVIMPAIEFLFGFAELRYAYRHVHTDFFEINCQKKKSNQIFVLLSQRIKCGWEFFTVSIISKKSFYPNKQK